ncbi:MAG: hypothetical protein OXC66_09990 [Roseovarius sp.]|nr:hypothetical protein [Roseovarius sp.]
MPSTEATVNVEAFGGFFEPGVDSGLKHARVAFSPSDLLEYRVGTDGSWADLAMLPNGQIRRTINKGDNPIQFRQKQNARMPTGGRRNIRVNLLPTCSDCRGAPLGTPISSTRTFFDNNVTNISREPRKCSKDDPGAQFSHKEQTDCRIRQSVDESVDSRGYRWMSCTPFSTNQGTMCGSVPNGIGSWVCTSTPVYMCPQPDRDNSRQRPNTPTYRVKNSAAIFHVQYDSDYCM